ncbi:MAG TPA: hypothetical protein DGT21_13075 [Armatimonadetes bacterium]|nr:hypothetical protein [Armatimonadota bacterium]
MEVDLWGIRVSTIHGQADPMLALLAQTQALILCLAPSAPGVLLARWHAALWREWRLRPLRESLSGACTGWSWMHSQKALCA